jgi:probable F420-dependent oxidoreductase
MVGMQIGLHALGIGPGADPEVIGAVGRTAEQCGFATLWAGEHVVMVDRPDSVYPYADDGRIEVPSDADWLDPLALFAFLAATTSRIRLATGVLLLPEHNPLIVAKHAASVDVLSGGRLTLGVGIGWSAEEYAALGVPFRGRGGRNREYVEAMRLLWTDDPSSYIGEYVHFERVRCYPKPVQHAIPIVLGGNGARALDRVARYGDGWYGFNLTLAELPERLEMLGAACQRHGRDATSIPTAAFVSDATPSDVPDLAALGLTELVLVESPPSAPDDASAWVEEAARRWGLETRATP